MHSSVKIWQGNYQVVTVHTLKVYRGSRGTDPLILNFSSEWSQVSNFTLLPLYLWGKNPDTHWIGDLVGLRASLGVLEKQMTYINLWNFSDSSLIIPQWQQNELDMNICKMDVILLHQFWCWTYSKTLVGENYVDLKYFGFWG